MDPFIGEIRLFGGTFAPADWAFCSGQLMSITSNTALFSILGVMYGGDGKVTFALPNLNGAVPVGAGAGPGLTARFQGDQGGSETVTLVEGQMPLHNHLAMGVGATGTAHSPENAVWSQFSTGSRPPVPSNLYVEQANTVMAPDALKVTGGAQAHNNMQPFLAMNFIISLKGVFPPRP